MKKQFENIVPGYYWAKTSGYEWFNVIIQVYGEAPFCKINGYDYSRERQIKDITDIDEIGECIKTD